MKTNVILKSVDRNLFGVTIKQNTIDGQMLSVSDLQKAYNKARFMHGWPERQISDVVRSKSFKERIYYTLLELDLINLQFLPFMEMIEKEGVTNVMKGLGIWKTKGRGETRSTYCNPYIWVLLAMEMNPMIYAKVVIWLTDSLITNRIVAGSNFLPMTQAIRRVVPNPKYWEYSRAINKKVFGRHERNIRNKASQKNLQKITDIEKFITQSIEIGVIQNERNLMAVIDKYKINND